LRRRCYSALVPIYLQIEGNAVMYSTKTAESNRYPYLLSLDMTLNENNELFARITFGKEAPGITGGLVHYCVKQAIIEVLVGDGEFGEVLLVNPANIADGVKTSRTREVTEKHGETHEKEAGGKVSGSIKSPAEVSVRGKEISQSGQGFSRKDTFNIRQFTLHYYGDRKTQSRWSFKPFEDSCLKGLLDSLLATVAPDDDKKAFIVDAFARIRPEDIDPVLIDGKKLNRLKDRVVKWFGQSQFDLKEPVSHVQLNVSTLDVQHEIDAA